MSKYGLILVTASSKEEAQMLGLALVEAQLAACINFFPVQSIYTWQGKTQSDSEYQLIIKTDLKLFAAIESQIKLLHSYTEPEIIALDLVAGSQSYLNWLSENLQ